MRDDVQDPADVHRHASVALSGPSEPPGQRNIALVTRLRRDHVRLHPAADQRQVAKDIGRLVADELIGPPQLSAHQAFLGEDEGGFERGAEREPARSKRVGFVQEAERPRACQLAAERLGGDVVAP